MGIFDKIFGSSKSISAEPDIRFGRFSDSYKTDKKYDAWDEALELFEEKKYLDSIRKFLFYLSNAEDDNIIVEEDNGEIKFEILQGSKSISGYANDKKFRAEAKVASSENPNIGLMRRLMEQNFTLKYAKYALDKDNNITMVFDTYLLDGSPYKLYYALKEIAINSDKQDDILIDEFKTLTPVNTGHIKEVDPGIKEVKYNFLQKKIKEAFDLVDNGKLNFDQYPGAVSYLYLNSTYMLDYFLSPEGLTLESFERIHHLFFANDGRPAVHKNNEIKKELQEVLDRDKESFYGELYSTTSTFGVTMPSGHERLTGFIDGELGNMDWYQKNKHLEISLSIPGYIVGYSFFNYALPAPDRDLLHLYYRILENDYFKSLGFERTFYADGDFKIKGIVSAIQEIRNKHKNKYLKFIPDVKSLNYNNAIDFARSYILMVRNLDLTRAERNLES